MTIKLKTTKRKLLFFVVVLILVLSFVILGALIVQKKVKSISNDQNIILTDEAKTSITKLAQFTPNPSKTQIVCLDPGHGGNDVGANYKDLYESNINLAVAQKTKNLLESEGYKVYLTRPEDVYVEKRARANYCNSINANVLVSIHHNSYDLDHTADYGVALYYKDSDKLLASSILDSTTNELKITGEGIAKFDSSLLWIANMPATISESYFISDNDEYNLLTESYSTRISDEAKGIANGIDNYFSNPEGIQTAQNADYVVDSIVDSSGLSK